MLSTEALSLWKIFFTANFFVILEWRISLKVTAPKDEGKKYRYHEEDIDKKTESNPSSDSPKPSCFDEESDD